MDGPIPAGAARRNALTRSPVTSVARRRGLGTATIPARPVPAGGKMNGLARHPVPHPRRDRASKRTERRASEAAAAKHAAEAAGGSAGVGKADEGNRRADGERGNPMRREHGDLLAGSTRGLRAGPMLVGQEGRSGGFFRSSESF